MRLLSLLGLIALFNSCVSSGKFKKTSLDYRAKIANLTDDVQVQQDSILSLRFQLERARGGNQALLATQDKLQDRLFAQEDELDDLKGNLSNTSAKLTGELAKAKATARRALAARDTFRLDQEQIIVSYQKGLDKAADLLDSIFRDTLTENQYQLTITGGEARLSVQEDVLFTRNSVTRLTGEAEIILGGIIEVLQADPLLKLTVEGHTDNRPNARRGTDNWQYAALRATRLAEELATAYYLSPNRVVAATHGEFGPIASNSTEIGRATNRRIDFILNNNVGNLLRELDKL